MDRRDPSAGGRLAAALGPTPRPMPAGGAWPPPDPAATDPPTVPLLFAGPAGRPSTGARCRPGSVAPAVVAPPGPAAAEPAASTGRLARALSALVPAGWRGARVDPGRPGATALALVAALAAVVAAVGVWSERPQTEAVAALPAVVVTTDAPASAPPSDSPDPSGPLVVAVSGKVADPGLVEVPDGARVADAVEAAGGTLPGTDLSGLNLARRVVDGEQIAVGVPPAPDAAGPVAAAPAHGGPAEPEGPVDLNAATAEQLDALPGVGPVTVQRILEWRERNGRFTRVEQLREIEGIGERRFAQLRELVAVS